MSLTRGTIQTGPYKEMGKTFVKENGFKEETVKRFAGPEIFPFYMRIMLSIMFKTVAKKRYAEVANKWGSKRAIDYKPWV